MGTQHDRLRVPEAPSGSRAGVSAPAAPGGPGHAHLGKPACCDGGAWRPPDYAGVLETRIHGAEPLQVPVSGLQEFLPHVCTHAYTCEESCPLTHVYTSTCPRITRMSRDLSKAKTVIHCLQTKR